MLQNGWMLESGFLQNDPENWSNLGLEASLFIVEISTGFFSLIYNDSFTRIWSHYYGEMNQSSTAGQITNKKLKSRSQSSSKRSGKAHRFETSKMEWVDGHRETWAFSAGASFWYSIALLVGIMMSFATGVPWRRVVSLFPADCRIQGISM